MIGDSLIAEARQSAAAPVEEVATVPTPASKISVFDSAAVVELDSIVDALAEDAATARGDSETDAVDQLFASF